MSGFDAVRRRWMAATVAVLVVVSLAAPASAAPPAAPGPVTNLTLAPVASGAFAGSTSMLDASWTAPATTPTARYIVKLHEGSSTTGKKVREVKTKQTEYGFASLTPGQTYTVSVTSQNRNSDGKTASTAATAMGTVPSKKFTPSTDTATAATAPGAAMNLTITKINQRAATITWTAPNPAPTHRYRIVLTSLSAEVLQVLEPKPSATRARITKLTPDTGYGISVTARNAGTESAPKRVTEGRSIGSSFRTKALPAAAVTPVVTSLTVDASTKNSLTVSWTPNPAATKHYAVELFQGNTKASFQALNGIAKKGLMHVGPSKTTAKLFGLTPGTSYKVKVTPVSKLTRAPGIFDGTAAEVTHSTTATSGGLPGLPGVTVAEESGTSSSFTLKVTWDAPTDTGGSDVKFYRVKILGGDSGEQFRRSAKKDKTYSYTGAKYDTEYTVVVQAKNDTGWGNKSMRYLTVAAPSPSP